MCMHMHMHMCMHMHMHMCMHMHMRHACLCLGDGARRALLEVLEDGLDRAWLGGGSGLGCG